MSPRRHPGARPRALGGWVAVRHGARPLGLATVATVTVGMGAALGSTPEGGGPYTEPVISPLDQFLGMAAPLTVAAVVLAILVGLAFAVSRIGGRAATSVPTTDAAPTTDPVARPTRASRRWLAVVGIGALLVGAVVGYQIAYQRSVGGLGGALGAGILIGLLGLTVAALVAVGVIALLFRRGDVSPTIAMILVAAPLLAVGGFAGSALAAPLGGTYRLPVVLQATGHTRFELQPGSMPFAARFDGAADCRSAADAPTVAEVDAMELGKLGPGTLRGMLSLSGPDSAIATAQFWIDGGDLPEGSDQPFWEGSVHVDEASADAGDGRMTFRGLALAVSAGKPSGESASPTSSADWPATISGTMSWTCLPW